MTGGRRQLGTAPKFSVRITRHPAFLPFSIETTKRSQSTHVSDRFDKILAVEFSQTDCESIANASILPYLSRSAA
jgi:hypothetical protein